MLREKEQILMEDRGWTFDDDDEPAIKYDGSGREVARENDPEWQSDLSIIRSIM